MGSLVIGTLFRPFIAKMLTIDRIGTFFGHKGAVYQARLAADASTAATASADFTAYVEK